MAKIATDDLLGAFKEMTLIELADFVKLFEETFGVTAAAPVAVAAAPAGGGAGGDSGSSDQDEFDVILEDGGDKKIQVIKEVRTLTNLDNQVIANSLQRNPPRTAKTVLGGFFFIKTLGFNRPGFTSLRFILIQMVKLIIKERKMLGTN